MSDLLPHNATDGERALSEAIARAGGGDLSLLIREQWNADTIPDTLLPWLAWAFSVDEWDTNWTDGQKRSAIKSALSVQSIKGTLGAVRRALSSVGITAEVQEWFAETPEGDPYTFALYIESDEQPVTLDGIDAVIRLVDAVKSIRSHLSNVVVVSRASGAGYFAGFPMIGSEITVTHFYEPVPILVANKIVVV